MNDGEKFFHLMKYQQAIDYLFDALPMYQRIGVAAYKADLQNARSLDEYFDFPHRRFKSIHVAGTNGKGSVSHILASVFQSAGYKTGLYTSPHLMDFRERIKINGKLINKQFVTDFTCENLDFFKKIQASFFEMTVFMAFDYFVKKKVDIAITETGLGGRLDTTNIITPELSIITNIGLDHTQFLGNTLKLIAAEKAGIIKPKVPVVIGKTQAETESVFNMIAANNESSIFFADQLNKCDYRLQNMDHSIRYHFSQNVHPDIEEIDTDLKGSYQEENINTALTALQVLNQSIFPVNVQAIKQGVRNVAANTGLRGRWQEIRYDPLVICDTAHNSEGIAEVISQIKATAHKSLHMIMGFVSDKSHENIIAQLVSRAEYLLVEPNIPRAAKNNDIEVLFKKYGLTCSKFATIGAAYTYAIEKSEANDLIFIGGSTFLVADFLSWKNSVKTF